MPITPTHRLSHAAAVERFMQHVATGEACWLWTGQRDANRYGLVRINGERTLAHRRAHELFIGLVPDGLMVLHSCDNPPCVNPAHLRAGTAADNGADMAARGRAHFSSATHCAAGHEFTPENTRTSMQRGRVRRHCRICRRATRRKHSGFTGAGRWPSTDSLRVR